MIQPQYAQPYAQGTPSANAVNIQIFEPKAYASPQPPQAGNYTNPLYNYPQASLYNMPAQYPYQMPQYPVMQAPYQPVNMPYPQVEQPAVYTVPPQVVSPVQQEMPAPVIEQQQQAIPAPAVQQTQNVVVQQPEQPAQTVDINALVAGLQSPDPAVQEKTITEIANYSQGEPGTAQQVLNEQIMGGLADIVAKDNSQLAGPTPEQQAALDKALKGEQLTEAETQLANQLAPKTAADKNKIIAMFTLAMLQKNQRDELDAYIASQGGGANIASLGTENLIGFNEIKNAVLTDTNPEVRLAGIQAISYVAKPEDAALIQSVLQNSLKDPEPLIQQAAQEVLNKFGATSTPAQPQQQTAANGAQQAA